MYSTEIAEEIALKTQETKVYNIVIYNDDVNTFVHVIKSLMDVCKHSLEQAEQCSVLIDLAGKCQVKQGSYLDLLPMCEALLERHLTAEIQ
jgi:ATP-dependent Clp protease adaptor protein ClpS